MKLFESEFYDYKTETVDGFDLIDTHKTGMSFYDDFLDPSQQSYLRDKKNLVGKIVMMSPEEYYEACSKEGFPDRQPSVETLKYQRRHDVNTLKHLNDVITIAKKKFPMPVLNKAEKAQEGLHRMMVVGDMIGWNTPVPVLVVDFADKNRAVEDAKAKKVSRIKNSIGKAVDKTLMFKFRNLDEFKDQLQWELDSEFDYNTDDIQVPVSYNLSFDEESDTYLIQVAFVGYRFDAEYLNIIDSTDSDDSDMDFDDLDVNDIDIAETEDFLKRYFGDNWRETHPHLRSTFNIQESIENIDIKEMDEFIQKEFAADNPGEGCIFIAPNGKFINIYPKLDDHEDLCYWLEENGFDDNPEEAEWFVDTFNYVRCRNSLHLCFVEVPKKMTSAQYSSLEVWLETKVTTDKLDIEAWSGEWKTYNLDDYFPEDIIRIIKRSYSSGKLYEKLK